MSVSPLTNLFEDPGNEVAVRQVAQRPLLLFERDCFWRNMKLQKISACIRLWLYVTCVLKKRRKLKRSMKSFQDWCWAILPLISLELGLMRESISSIITIFSRLFLKSSTLVSVMEKKKKPTQQNLILHFTKPKIHSQIVYILSLLKILASYIVLCSACFHLYHGRSPCS